jgi:hypothetical protein
LKEEGAGKLNIQMIKHFEASEVESGLEVVLRCREVELNVNRKSLDIQWECWCGMCLL